MDDQYIAEMNQRLERYEELFHDQYLIKQDQALVPEEIKDQGIYAKNELENIVKQDCEYLKNSNLYQTMISFKNDFIKEEGL